MRRTHTSLAALVLLAACAAPQRAARESAPLFWPEPPERARIAFVAAISAPRDFGITKGWLRRAGDVLFGAAEERMVRPMAVVASGETLFVADPGAGGVHRFDRAGGRFDLIRGENGAPMVSPVGLALGPQGEVYVTDSVRGEVLAIAPGAREARRLRLEPIEQPTGIAYDAASDRLYVADTGADRVYAFSRDGTWRATLGRRGSGPGEFNRPTHLWCDGHGALLVSDALNYRVQVFDAAGRFVRAFGQAGDATGDFMRNKGVATDRHGHVYVVDGLLGQLQIFDGEGRLLIVLGSLGSDPGEFWLPNGLFIGSDDRIYVADSYNGRVQLLVYLGEAP